MFKSLRLALVAALSSSGVIGGAALLGATPASATITPQNSFVNCVFANALNRAPDSAGLTYYLNILGTAVPPSSPLPFNVAFQVYRSSEYRQVLVTHDYTNYLHRSVDSAGLAYWSNVLATSTDEAVAANLIASPEYFATRGASNFDTWLTQVYSDVLGRGVDTSGRTYFDNLNTAGVSRLSIVTQLLNSLEGRNARVTGWYTTLLQRSGEASGIAYYSSLLASGQSDEQVESMIASSLEAWNSGCAT